MTRSLNVLSGGDLRDLSAEANLTIPLRGCDLASWQENLQALTRLSTWELETCLSGREIREHGPDDFFQIIYSAFTICLDWSQATQVVDVLSLAQSLQEQDEVKEVMAHEILPDKLFFTTVFASHLSRVRSNQISRHASLLSLDLCADRAEAFLEIWEDHVYPILKAAENEMWAEKWRGGHIANDVV